MSWDSDIDEYCKLRGREPQHVRTILKRKAWNKKLYQPSMKSELFEFLDKWYTLSIKKLPSPATNRKNPIKGHQAVDCGLLALALHELTGLPLYGVRDSFGNLQHSFVYDDETENMIDIMGIQPMQYFLQRIDKSRIVATVPVKQYNSNDWSYALKCAQKILEGAYD